MAVASAAARPPARLDVLAIRALRFWLVNYRRTWRGSIYTSVANPVLYLGAMGLGLGTLVDQHGTARLGGVSYLAFLAPGLLASTAMQTAMGESTFPVMAAVKWLKTYQAAVATPLRPADLFRGHLLFTALRNEEGWLVSLPQIMRLIKGRSANFVNKLLDRQGRVWQEESFDHVLRSNESLSEKMN